MYMYSVDHVFLYYTHEIGGNLCSMYVYFVTEGNQCIDIHITLLLPCL